MPSTFLKVMGCGSVDKPMDFTEICVRSLHWLPDLKVDRVKVTLLSVFRGSRKVWCGGHSESNLPN